MSLFPIQQKCLEPIYEGKDLIGRDYTGSGKTLAFALPIVEKLRKTGLLGTKKPQCAVLTPTRELAQQVHQTFVSLKHTQDEFNVIPVYGGVPV